jgi:hypothetical protein
VVSVTEAMKILLRSLRFGDPWQIAALKRLEHPEEGCQECESTGYCQACGGTGRCPECALPNDYE